MVGPTQEPKSRQQNKNSPSRTVDNSGQVSKCTRVKTGCKTCRIRRKKCGEQRPACLNCIKSNNVCLGYPEPTLFQERRRRAIRRSPSKPSPERVARCNLGTIHVKTSYPVSPEHDFLQIAALGNGSAPGFEDGIETVFTPLGRPQHQGYTSGDGSGVFLGGSEDNIQSYIHTTARQRVTTFPQFAAQFAQSRQFPRSLPYPIPGVENRGQEYFYHNFATRLSKLLTIADGGSIPTMDNIIPFALEDSIVMKTLLGLSGAHIFQRLGPNMHPMLVAETTRLQRQAHSGQAERLQALHAGHPASQSLRNIEIVFATANLFILYPICEGSSNNATQQYLEAAWRVLLKLIPETTTLTALPQPKIVPKVNPFLLEFFLYHHSLSLVTMPALHSNWCQIVDLVEVPRQVTSLVGVRDGLRYFSSRIASFRAEVRSAGYLDGNTLNTATQIYHDLESWQPPPTASDNEKKVAKLYQWAFAAWLFSICNPGKKDHRQLQGDLSSKIAEISNVSESMNSCMLFPMFMAGGAAITVEDRDAMTALLKKLHSWSDFGNIDFSLSFVQDMWRDYDNGVSDSWNWVDALQRQGKTLLVT